MIPLATKNLTPTTQAELDQLQQKVNSERFFDDRTQKAQALWKSKGGANGQRAFREVFEKLAQMCVYVEVCNYCEQSEANDIEHIYPKSFFPELTFAWPNYILACKQCNTAYKLDKCFVLDSNGNVLEVPRKTQPPSNQGAFINPRLENPNDFMILSLTSFKFEVLPDLPNAQCNKAEKTIEILQLNNRDVLVAARKSAARHYFETLDRLIRILEAVTIDEIRAILTPYDTEINLNQALSDIKNEIRESLKIYITSYQHPSVWFSIKTIESKVNPKWNTLFQRFPEALHW
jgi:uncharacterized protein (TIGR02646 family)